MQKQAPTLGRIAVMTLFALSCFGLLLFLWQSFGGSTPLKPVGYRVEAVFPEGTQLADQGDIRVAGVPVGKVVRTDRAPAGKGTLATLEIDGRYAPLPADARAMLREKTLLGETYVELTLGTPGSRTVPEGGRLASAGVREGVQLDEILGALDAPTRDAFRTWQRQLGRAMRDRGPSLNATIARLPQFAAEGTDVLQVLDDEAADLRVFVRETGRVFAALGRRQDRLRTLVTASGDVFGETAQHREALADSVAILPTFLRELRATLRRTERFAVAADPVVRDLRPALADLRPALVAARRASPDIRTVARRVPALARAADTGLPAASEVLDGLRPVLAAAGPLLSELNPLLEWLEYNQRLTIGVFNAPPGLSYTVPPDNPGTVGRVLRSLAPAGLESLAIWPQRLPQHRGNAYPNPADHAGRRYADKMIQPSWDCNNTGRGEFTTRKRDTDDQPSCWTTGWPGRKEGPGQFPHIERADYTKGGP